jgi:arylsulfatase
VRKRLLWVVALVVVVGLAGWSYHTRRARVKPPAPLAPPVKPWTNPPAPHTPPEAPLPGRPFSDRGVVYATPTPSRASLRAAAAGLNLVICVLDAARADHFGAYGYPLPTTPSFDELAEHALVFEQHFCQAPHTRPSTASLFTSQYPDQHGIISNGAAEDREVGGLDPRIFTLERGLQRAGFSTYLFSAMASASPEMGIGEDFQVAERMWSAGPNLTTAPEAFMAHAFGKMQADRAGKPQGRFYAYLHVLPPHQPILAPGPTLALFARKRPPRYWESKVEFPEVMRDRHYVEEPDWWVKWSNEYDANLRFSDAFVGCLVERLKQQGVWDRTLLIVTADHGEALREHGFGFHTGVPYDEAQHIPLLIRFPGTHPPTGRVKALTQTIDLLPTLLDLYGIGYPRHQVQGKSLVPLLTGEKRRINEYLFARSTAIRMATYTIRDAHSTLLLYRGGKPRALYDMDADPYQTRNIVAEQPARAEKLVKAFTEFARRQRYRPLNFVHPEFVPPSRGALPEKQLSEETRRTLKTLGYIK